MADHEPSPRRLAAARRQGRIARGDALAAAAGLAAGLLLIAGASGALWEALATVVREGLSRAFTAVAPGAALRAAGWSALRLALPVVLVVAAAALLVGAVAHRGVWAPGAGRAAGSVALRLLPLATATSVLAAAVVALPRPAELGALAGRGDAVARAGGIALRLGLAAAAVIVAGGAISLWLSRRALVRSLEPSLAEERRELRDEHGAPEVRAARGERR